MLRDGVLYRDLGADHFTRDDKAKTIGPCRQPASRLGCVVEHGSLRFLAKAVVLTPEGFMLQVYRRERKTIARETSENRQISVNATLEPAPRFGVQSPELSDSVDHNPEP